MLKKMIVFIACGFGTGFAPVAPGTFGSLLGILAYFIISQFTFTTQIAIILGIIIASVILAHIAAKILDKPDPGEIVIDEIAGQVIALWGVELTFINIVVGFALFRFFDILKPYPIKMLEKKVPGGAGIVIDDLVAGVFARIGLFIFIIIYNLLVS